MFSNACDLVRQFTQPTILCFRTLDGKCQTVLGAFILLNNEGWVLTAAHILDYYKKLLDIQVQNAAALAKKAAIQARTDLKERDRAHMLKSIKLPPTMITHVGMLWGDTGCDFSEFYTIPEVDLALCRLTNFTPAPGQTYPRFKDPATPMRQGTSLCKYGYPFTTANVGFDTKAGKFDLPPGAFPLPSFPLEGIMTKAIPMSSASTQDPHVPCIYLQTSSPGLKGQSGGPTFDVDGNIWAIQCKTEHLQLKFGDHLHNYTKDEEHLKNQYLNVGLGAHAKTIVEFLSQHNVQFTLA